MKQFILLTVLSLFIFSCDYQPEYIYEDEKYTAVVIDKKESIETEHVYTENFFGSGDSVFKKVPETKTVYYVIFDDGTVKKTNIQDYYKYKLGDSYYLYRCVKRLNPKRKKG